MPDDRFIIMVATRKADLPLVQADDGQVVAIITKIQLDLGIAEARLLVDEDIDNLMVYVGAAFPRITSEDLPLAALLLMAGKLLDTDGKPLKASSHFQTFSPAWVLEWLGAYTRYCDYAARQYRERLSLPAPDPAPTAWQRTKADLEFRLHVLTAAQAVWNATEHYQLADLEFRLHVLTAAQAVWNDTEYYQLADLEYILPHAADWIADQGFYTLPDESRAEVKTRIAGLSLREDVAETRLRMALAIETIRGFCAAHPGQVRQCLSLHLLNSLPEDQARHITERLRADDDSFPLPEALAAVYQTTPKK